MQVLIFMYIQSIVEAVQLLVFPQITAFITQLVHFVEAGWTK